MSLNYSSKISETEKILLNSFKQTFGDNEYTDMLFKQIVRGQYDNALINKREVNKPPKCLDNKKHHHHHHCNNINIDLKEYLLYKLHDRNTDTALDGNEVIKINTNATPTNKAVVFCYQNVEIAYIDIYGGFHGKLGDYTIAEIETILSGAITPEEFQSHLNNYISKNDLFDENNKILLELIPEDIKNSIITSEDKDRWDSKYDLPQTGIPLSDISDEVRNKLTATFNSYEEAVEYANNDSNAYNLQLITVNENNSVSLYILTSKENGKEGYDLVNPIDLDIEDKIKDISLDIQSLKWEELD